MQSAPLVKNQHGDALEWHGIGFLIVGPPNSGKSELALALIGQGAQLIADDQVLLNGTIATCPEPIKGMLHTRSGGFYTFPFLPQTDIRFIIQSDMPAKPLSQPPPLNVPIHQMDLRTEHTQGQILEIIEKFKRL